MSDRALHIGLVAPLPPPNGGMAMQALQLQRLLLDAGVSVDMVQTNAPYRPAAIARLRGVRAVFRLLPYLLRLWKVAGRVQVIHLMANSGWSWQLFAAPAVWIGWLRGTPVIVNYRGGEAREYLSRSISRVRFTLNRASRLVVPSGFLKQVFAEFGIGANIIHNIIDLDAFSPTAPPLERDTFNVVVTRNLEAIYGLDVALHAFATAVRQEPTMQLHIAGSGPQREQLQALAQELGVSESVHFVGRLEREGIIALYRTADVMLNPTRVDNMPNSVLEALACGLPVVSTRVGGVPYIVEDRRTALLTEPGNADEMAAALLTLARDNALYAELAENGRREVMQYGWDRVGSQWLSLYKELGAVT